MLFTNRNEVRDMFWDTLGHNGWEHIMEENEDENGIVTISTDDLSTYKLTILVDYKCDCYARVAECKKQLEVNGHYGVAWIDVLSEVKPPYDYRDIVEMLRAVELAEENLLAIGVPFEKGYEFHGRNLESKTRRNNLLREQWNLEAQENEGE